VTRAHQVVSGAGPYDAVTGQAFAWRDELAMLGMEGEVYAGSVDPRARRGVKPLERLGEADLLVIHHSAHAPGLERVFEHPGRRLLVYHNVTPARYFWQHHPGVAVACALGRAQLPAWVRGCHAVAAVSEFNARELREAGADGVVVVPPVLHEDRFRIRPGKHPGAGDGPLVLCVGRLAPHKRHDLVIETFAHYQRGCAPDARLLLAGEPLSSAYHALVEGHVRRSGARNVSVPGGLSQPALNGAFVDAADTGVLISMSEHEGFCIPLLEAFTYPIPVVARPAGALPEVGGDAVLWTDADPDPVVAAELIDLAVRDGELREELGRRGRARVESGEFHWREPLKRAVEAALG
jgi:glycosyltransferase involved in cell wall biosynthesis